MIFCLPQLQEKCIEQDRPLYIVFVDFTKAFNTVGKTVAAAEEICMPRKVHNQIEVLHTGIMVKVRNGGEVSDIFAITKGVKQGCVLAPTIFSIFLSEMLEEAFRDMWDIVYIQSRQNADLFTVSHFRTEEIQRIVDAFANASSKFVLKINIKKTEVMFQSNSTTTMEEGINVDETTLNPVKEFTYLGSIIARDGHIEAELQKRMSKASMSFGRLRERLWNNHNVSIRVKGKIYRAIIPY